MLGKIGVMSHPAQSPPGMINAEHVNHTNHENRSHVNSESTICHHPANRSPTLLSTFCSLSLSTNRTQAPLVLFCMLHASAGWFYEIIYMCMRFFHKGDGYF